MTPVKCLINLLEPQFLGGLLGNAAVAGLALAPRALRCFCVSLRPPQIDLAIDGADEVDADLNLIKGGG